MWRYAAAYRLIDRTLAERMPRDDYVGARRAGAAMALPELVAFASSYVQEVTGGNRPG
jgi:hypothetical protein